MNAILVQPNLQAGAPVITFIAVCVESQRPSAPNWHTLAHGSGVSHLSLYELIQFCDAICTTACVHTVSATQHLEAWPWLPHSLMALSSESTAISDSHVNFILQRVIKENIEKYSLKPQSLKLKYCVDELCVVNLYIFGMKHPLVDRYKESKNHIP